MELLFFNVQILTSLNNKGDINLLGIKISLYSASATTGYKHLYAWWDTGLSGGPGGSDLFLCVIPGEQCAPYGASGWGF